MLPRIPRRHGRAPRAVFALLSLALPLVLLPGHPAQAAERTEAVERAVAAERTVAGGRLDWGVKTSFQTYVTGPIANGAYELTGGAATVGESQFRFHSARGGYDPDTGAFEAAYGGGVHFTGHRQDDGSHELDLTLSNPTVRVAGTSGTLHADMRSRERGTGVVTETAQVPLADLDLTGVDLRGGTALAVTGIPASLTAEGATAFAGYYRAGDALDPVTLTADTEAPAEPEPEPSDTGDEEDAGNGRNEDGAIADGAVDWGVRRTFREYVTGPIAEGAWQLADGAQDGGALFRFPVASGTADPERGTVEAGFTGTVRFTGSELDLRLGGFTVTVADGEGTLAADVTRDGGEPAPDRPLITFEAPAADLAPRDGLILLNEAPAELTAEGAAAFGGLYPPGTAMDPVTLAVALDDTAELPPLPDLGDEPAAEEPEPAPESEPGDAAAEPAAGSGDDGGAPATALLATGAGALLALAAAYLLLRRNRRAAHPDTPDIQDTPRETDPS